MKLKCLDLFSGIGGISYALRDYCETVAYCEIEKYCQYVLMSRMEDNDLDTATIWDDVTTLNGREIKRIDIITGGFPCQNISISGLGEGLAGKQSGLFFEIMRLAEEIKPKFIFLENVPAIRTRGLSTVGRELAKRGYDSKWITVTARSVGAPHKRERWFCLAGRIEESADSYAKRLSEYDFTASSPESSPDSGKNNETIRTTEIADTDSERCKENVYTRIREIARQSNCSNGARRFTWDEIEPCVLRTDHALPFDVDRVKALGNTIVPAQVKEAFERLMGLK